MLSTVDWSSECSSIGPAACCAIHAFKLDTARTSVLTRINLWPAQNVELSCLPDPMTTLLMTATYVAEIAVESMQQITPIVQYVKRLTKLEEKLQEAASNAT
ncbi:hypothetical protein HPB49_013142 [Dermacentor silvarum]|uniref:Uncharacterized protein n=1 Tax=Dermacentor silvarum TaxID=543639 RepID=A0ACB8E053_DERSI|nr:hypothetical protein HPB49_013142 [Dermacentor silvarum]